MAAWKSCNLFAGEGVYLSMLRPLDVTFAHTDQDLLQILMSSATLRVRRVERARIILGAAAGRPDRDLAAELDCSRQCCARTRRRFQAGGFKTLSGDAPGPGWPRRHDHNRIADLTTQTRPANATDWSTRLMAERAAP
jgi:hypothetical protein